MTQTVLVTGAHGFLGRNVAKLYLRQGYRVVGIGHGAWSDSDRAFCALSAWHSADVTLENLVTYAEEPMAIVHCAGSGSVSFSVAHPYQDFTRTVGSTAAVLEYIRLHSPETRLVYPSSAAVYGTAARLPLREDDSPNPASPYGVHKLMAEQLCQSAASTYGVRVAIVRFFSVYGEGLRKQLLWDACSKLETGVCDFFGSGMELRDWIHVEDAARLVALALAHASSQAPIVNGATGTGVTVSAVLSTLSSAFGDELVPHFNGKVRPGDPPGYEASVELATAWGFKSAIDLETGLKRYAQWFLAGAR